MKTISPAFVVYCLLSFPCLSLANEADIVNVKVQKSSATSYNFRVTVLHKDTGWDHYADKWDIVGEDGRLLGTRILYHPHVSEQPFTRGLSNVHIPATVHRVTVRVHDSVHEYGGKSITVKMPSTE